MTNTNFLSVTKKKRKEQVAAKVDKRKKQTRRKSRIY